MEMPFEVKPKHWWDYLNPFWWRKKRAVEALARCMWAKHDLSRKLDKALHDALLYGEGVLRIKL